MYKFSCIEAMDTKHTSLASILKSQDIRNLQLNYKAFCPELIQDFTYVSQKRNTVIPLYGLLRKMHIIRASHYLVLGWLKMKTWCPLNIYNIYKSAVHHANIQQYTGQDIPSILL